jgi:hypothetical protein
MNAHMLTQQMNKKNLVTDFMKTVQYNYKLDHACMNTIDVHQKDGFGNTSLYWAIYHHNMHNVNLLFYYGCTLVTSENSKTAPFCAVDSNNLDVLMYMVDRGMDIFQEYNGESLLEYIERLGSKEMKVYVQKIHRSRYIT